MKKLLILIVGALMLQGCIPLMIAGSGYAIGQGRKGNAELIKAKAQYAEKYNTYKLGMEDINLKREQSKLQPQPILTFEQWLDQQPLTPEEIKMFKYYKGQTTNEIKTQSKK